MFLETDDLRGISLYKGFPCSVPRFWISGVLTQAESGFPGLECPRPQGIPP